MVLPLLVAVGAATVAGASASPVRGAAPVGIRLRSSTLWVAPKDAVVTTVALSGVPAGASLHTTLRGAVPTRSAYALAAKGQNVTAEIHAFPDQDLRAGATSASVRFNVSDGTGAAPADDAVTLTRPGVYPLQIEVRDQAGTPTATLNTFLVRLGPAPATGETRNQKPLHVATELRLATPPSHDARGAVDLSTTTRRRVERLVAGLNGRPRTGDAAAVELGITPELLDALAQSNRASDRQLLADLRLDTEPYSLSRLTSVSIDLKRWLTTPSLTGRASEQLASGSRTTTERLHGVDDGTADLARWSTTSPATVGEVTWLADQGATRFLVPEASLETLDPASFPRSLAAPFDLALPDGRHVRAVQTDPALTAYFENDDPVLGANHLLADLAVMALDLPALDRGVAVASPMSWSPSPAFLRAYLDGLDSAAPTGTSPLVSSTSMSSLFDDVPLARAGGDESTEGPVLVRPLRPATKPAPLTSLGVDSARTTASIVSLAEMVPGGARESARTVAALKGRVTVAASSALSVDEQTRRLAAVRADVQSTIATVRLPSTQTVTLTSRTADLPLTVHRPADGPTVVRLTFDTPTRLHLVDGASRVVHLKGASTQIRVRVHADAPGDSIVHVTATSPNGTLLAGSTKLVVRSTAVSGMGLVISFGSLAFLFLWWGRDIVRVRRRRRADRVRPADLIDLPHGTDIDDM